jgi:D-alanyl-D-alanine dipeptidase
MEMLRPVPRSMTEPDCSNVILLECREPLVALRNEPRIFVSPAYHGLGYATATDEIFVRTGTLAALRRAAAALPDGISLLIWDGLRRLETQREIVQRFEKSFDDTVLSAHERAELAARYVSRLPDSRLDFRMSPPPHATGGAVDLSLCLENGVALDLGAGFDQFDETAWLSHYENAPETADPGMKARRNLRRTLHWAMTGAGFTHYAWEYWHFEIGTLRAAARRNSPVAIYGPAVPWIEGDQDHACSTRRLCGYHRARIPVSRRRSAHAFRSRRASADLGPAPRHSG